MTDPLRQDIRTALRVLGRARGFTLAALIMLVAFLVGVTPLDPATFAAVAGLLLLAAALATLLPAARAARVDPARALRAE